MSSKVYRPLAVIAAALSLAMVGAACSSAATANTTTAPASTASPSSDHVVVDATLSDFAIALSTASAPAGEVIFQITNAGASGHEMVVLKTDEPASSFPVTGFEGEPNRFDEDAKGLTNVGETGDTPIAPGASDTLTLHLTPGHYAIVCNLNGHYMAGMHEDFTVTG